MTLALWANSHTIRCTVLATFPYYRGYPVGRWSLSNWDHILCRCSVPLK